MKPIKKPTRVKPKSSQIQKKLTSDLLSKWDYIIASKNSVEFVQPPQTRWNRILTLISPIAKVDDTGKFSPNGKMGPLTTYYLPNNQYSTVIGYFRDFGIAEQFHVDLIWVFLNMVFAASEASAETKLKHENHSNHKEWINAFGILENLADEKYILKEVILEYEVANDISVEKERSGSRMTKKNKFKAKNVLELFIKMIQHYKTAEPFDLSKIGIDFVKQVGIEPPFEGYKNVEKKWQSYFSVVVYYYLAFQGDEAKLAAIQGHTKDNIIISSTKIGLSNRRIYLLIGKLMLLSGLINVKEKTLVNSSLEEALIETIEKKIQPEIKSKMKLNRYKNHLLNQGIVSLDVPPFYYHFLQE